MKESIYSVNGPVITAKNTKAFKMQERVEVGEARLVGEVITVTDAQTTIQVYETTTGVKVGEPIYPTGSPLSAQLGPGLVSNIFDGILRPLKVLEDKSGSFIATGVTADSLDGERRFAVSIKVKDGDVVSGGHIIATCPETPAIEHRSMVPPRLKGTISGVVADGEYTVGERLCTLTDDYGTEHELTLAQQWPIRTARPVKRRIAISKPLITGQRVVDSLFPIAKGGAAAIPGGFGTGKTMTQHQLAKWCDADLIIYIGCGERGNEMTQVLEEFGELVDPKSGRPITIFSKPSD